MFFWTAGSWFALRVAIDRSLLQTLGEIPEAGPDWLDALLMQWRFVKEKRSRSISDRSRGALRLLRMQGTALLLQLAVLGVGILTTTVRL